MQNAHSAQPPRLRTRKLRIGQLRYRSERFPSGSTLRVLTWRGRFIWRNDRGQR